MSKIKISIWDSPVTEARWRGFRRECRGLEAFASSGQFEKAQKSELEESLDDFERETLGRLIQRGNKTEIEVFVKTHGANPIFPPKDEIEVDVGVAWADVLDLRDIPSLEATRAILNGEVVHLLFQAGEASRFQEGPFYNLIPFSIAEKFKDELKLEDQLARIKKMAQQAGELAANFLLQTALGPRQPLMIRAAIRRLIAEEVRSGQMSLREAAIAYNQALNNQKILFFVSPRSGVEKAHAEALKKFEFFGFNPANIVTVEQELIRGLACDERGNVNLLEGEGTSDAAGHLYALIQAVRAGDFITYAANGEPVTFPDVDALEYMAQRGGKILSVIRINDMDRHTTEIINAKAVSFAQKMFAQGYVNVIEGVSNPHGQKGGTGTTFNDPNIHVLTETHENSFPALSRAFEKGMSTYLAAHQGHHPAYNAMRQLSDLAATRQVLKEYGGRIVFVPRQKEINGEKASYLGVDMPMGDLSLLHGRYKSRMFQFFGSNGTGLLIHDMKFKENLPLALAALERQLQDEHILAATEELLSGKIVEFKKTGALPALYNAPAPELS